MRKTLTAGVVALGLVLAAPAGAAPHGRTYFAEARGEVSTTSEPATGEQIVDLGGPSITLNVPAKAKVQLRLSVEGQTSPDPYGNYSGVFAYVVDSKGQIALGADWVGGAPSDSAWHTYTGAWTAPTTKGVDTYKVLYSEAPTLGIGGVVGPYPSANFRDRELWVTVTPAQ